MKPRVVLVGRPNVGKSTLFNRLVGYRAAITEDAPGVTRDRREADAEVDGRPYTLVDTGGFVPGAKDALLKRMRAEALSALEGVSTAIWVVDAQTGPMPADEEIALVLRKRGIRVVTAVNKVDGPDAVGKNLAAEFHRFGLTPLVTLSAAHGWGVRELQEALIERLPEAEEEAEGAPEAETPIRVAIVGRPNVGKSSLANALLKEERFIASPVPGTTRDALDAELTHGGRRFVLTDTAGIRKKRALSERVERSSVSAAFEAVEKSDVAVLVIDATEAAVDQDARIAQLSFEKGRALMICVNKWDLVPRTPSGEDQFRAALKERFKFVAWAPIVFTSALHRRRVDKVLEVAAQLFDELTFRAPTPRLNRLLAQVSSEHPAPIARGKPLRIYYIAQVSVAPPSFALTCNQPREVPEFYQRFLINQLRAAFRLRVPIRLFFRERPGQAKRQARKRVRQRH